MMHLQKNILAILLLCFIVLLRTSSGFAEELYRHFSLDSSSLTNIPIDTKTPEPGIVTAKYGFLFAKDFMTYLGTGLAYRYQSDNNTGDVTNLETGLAAQIGFNYLLGTNAVLKFDYKYLSLSPEQSRGDSRTPPQSLGVGLDIKF